MRPVLALALFLAAAWAGSRKRAGLEARIRVLSVFLSDIRKLRDIMELTPVPIAQAAQRLNCELWACFVGNMQSCGARAAWMKALDECGAYEGDRDVLEGFADVLRANEMRAQQNALTLLLRELEERRGMLTAELEKKGKVYSSLGVLLGLSLALLVI
jgi:stage III sporulation protein AB